jgi:hypothetical protein
MMDDATIKGIAAAIAAHLPTYLWVPLLLQVLLTGLVAGLVVFLSEYLKARGKNLATKADFESLQQQLHANTELVETIKAEVGQRDWARREWTNLRRLKLEALLDKLHECESYLDRHRHESAEGKTLVADRDFGAQLDTLQTLYFPELVKEVGAYLVMYHDRLAAGGDLVVKLLQSGTDLGMRQKAFDEYVAKAGNSPSFKSRSDVVRAVRSAARNVLLGIMGVD